MKKIVIVVLCILHLKISSAQKFMHAVGNTTSLIFGKLRDNGNNTEPFSLFQTSVSYFPRINFIESSNSSISIGSPISGGVGFSRGDGDAGIYFSYDLPLVIDYNFGCNSSYGNYSRSGGYVGIGYGHYKVSIKQAFSDFDGSTTGPMMRVGYRYIPKKSDYIGRGVTFGLFYKKGTEREKLTTIAFSFMYDL